MKTNRFKSVLVLTIAGLLLANFADAQLAACSCAHCSSVSQVIVR